jgi:hypothetical protein
MRSNFIICGVGEVIVADYIDAHAFSSNHKEALKKDGLCGCFYCMEIFDPRLITEWVADVSGTALCPFCGIDSIIGQNSGYPITEEFLSEMNQYWF